MPVMTRSVHDLAGASSREIHRLVERSVHGGSSLYALDEAAMAAAEPDLILTQELCTVCAVGYRRGQRGRPADRRRHRGRVARADQPRGDPQHDRHGRRDDRRRGRGRSMSSAACASASGQVEARVAERRAAGRTPVRVVGLEWLDPPFAVGHWVPEQIRRAGAWDLLGAEGERSVETSWDAVRDVDPEMLVLMPCGFHLADGLEAWRATPRPAGWAELSAVRDGQVYLVDGSAYFSRPGPRVIDGVELLAELFDPDGLRRQRPVRQLAAGSTRRWSSGRRSTACGAGRPTPSRAADDLEGYAQLCPTASAGPARTASCASGSSRPWPSRRSGQAGSPVAGPAQSQV